MSTELGGEIEGVDGQFGNEVSLSRQHLLLANPYRRLALSILEKQTAPMSLEDLAIHLSRAEVADESISANLDEINILLHHCHLPKLAAHGIIEYDRADRIVTVG